ncbi:metallophosphoesterase [Flavobacterium sp. PL002]|uniref:metallophosphoesterase n=1 Tax=Flavobacterium sp. PL002 TaxID=1897058 RepID=UPI0017882EB1|nr:metallophosphoesterase [Flavobacterium sp. PL002]
MKMFSDNRFIKNKIFLYLPIVLFLLQSCATKKAQYGSKVETPVPQNEADTAKVTHTFFLVGDAGNADETEPQKMLQLLQEQLVVANKNSTLLFLGDNIYPKGLPSKKDDANYKIAEDKLLAQLALTKQFKGKTVFIPGNHDWYSGIKALEKQGEFITDYLNDKHAFSPQKTCAIDDIEINDLTTLITIDSQWFLEDWNKSPTINDNCDIKTREDFFAELESLLSKNKDKTVILALHHPLLSNGTHGGQFSLKKQLFPLEQKIPLPVIGSVINFLRKTSGISPQDIQNKKYSELSNRIQTYVKGFTNVIVVSGHDHNLQYIDHENIKQIISGAGSKSEAAKAVYPNDFSYGKNGFATLSLYDTGKAMVSFYGRENDKLNLLFKKTILFPKTKVTLDYPTTFPDTIKASVYTPDMIDKSSVHNFLFGKHYREYFGKQIAVKTITLDQLYAGVTPTIAGGGHQSKSLRLEDANGKEYVMRAVKKSVSRFLQNVAFKDQYVEESFQNTIAEDFLYDFYTTSHPYAPLSVGNLAEKIGVAHTNPLLYYIPKQNQLKDFNENFGDELYLVEERPSKEQKNLAGFGDTPIDIISTDDVLENLRKDEKYAVDQDEYIKARLFDMLIGDWDRHYDQWRWGEYKVGDKVIYKPIPRDRDQAFSKYDGTLLSILMNIPALRHMQSFKKDIKNVKWFNREAYTLDLAFLKTAAEKDWLAQAKYIQDNLSDDDIAHAFDNLPTEVKDHTIEEIKANIKSRRTKLTQYAARYYHVLQKTVLLVGTNKKDRFVIDRTAKKEIVVTVSRLKKEGEQFMYKKTFTHKSTKNIWVYGLDDDDEFVVKGTRNNGINIRLIGGQNNDIYTIEKGKNIEIIDFKSKDNTYAIDSKTKKSLTDDYETILYDYRKPKYNFFSGLPILGFNPDDGVKIGIIANYTVNRFKQNPYTRKHLLKANYYFATGGFELLYNLSVPKLIGDFDFNLDTQFTSPNFAINYFGYGNNTINNDEEDGKDFNRVRIRILKAAPQLTRIGKNGSIIKFKTEIENIDVERINDRFIRLSNSINPAVFDNQLFAGACIKYSFDNNDNTAFPTIGMGFSITGSWKINLEDTKRNFPTIESKLNFNHKIDANGKLVLATLLKGKAILNNNFEFYQAAALGGDYDLRGFRNERFIGNQSFFQSSDIRWNIGQIKRNIIPMTYGILGGFDYGRVWLNGENSSKWHQSVGGGLWLNGLDILTARITYFKSADDQGRLTFGLGLGF